MNSKTQLILFATIIMIIAMHLPNDEVSILPMSIIDKVFYLCWSVAFILILYANVDKYKKDKDNYIIIWCRDLSIINFANETLPWIDCTKKWNVLEYIAAIIVTIHIYLKYKKENATT